MDTVMELQIAGKKDYTPEAEEYIRRLEKELSVTDPGSEIAKVNESGEGELSEEVGDILEGALDVCERTDGALDITVYPVLKAWGFTTGNYRVPSEGELSELLYSVGYRKVVLERGQSEASEMNEGGNAGAHVSLQDDMEIDLGSVAKGYTGTAVSDMLREKGVEHALINLGGNVQCIGSKPNGDPWKVAVKSPFPDSASGMIGVIDADDVAIITSGGYERYFEEEGKTYWHILDPVTGKPAESGLVSVTIVGRDGLLCDGLSTALFVEGLDKAIEEYKRSDDFEAIFVTEDRQVYVTEGIADKFALSSEYYDLPLHVVSR
ncbi:MAG: FAD:protein FMN transferase [Butyrivibrio sp.]|nr:FAD:protein FMN transferase [Butyrivibrio sp.]